jgi:hypothetical protein
MEIASNCRDIRSVDRLYPWTYVTRLRIIIIEISSSLTSHLTISSEVHSTQWRSIINSSVLKLLLPKHLRNDVLAAYYNNPWRFSTERILFRLLTQFSECFLSGSTSSRRRPQIQPVVDLTKGRTPPPDHRPRFNLQRSIVHFIPAWLFFLLASRTVTLSFVLL